ARLRLGGEAPRPRLRRAPGRVEPPVDPAVQFALRAGPAQLVEVQGLHEALLRTEARERRGAVGRVRGGDGVDGYRVLDLKGAQVEAAVDGAREAGAALVGGGQAGDAGVAGPVGRTVRRRRLRRRGAAVVLQRAQFRVAADGAAGGHAGVGEFVRLDEVGAAGDGGRVGVVAVDGVGEQVGAPGGVGQDVVVERQRGDDCAAADDFVAVSQVEDGPAVGLAIDAVGAARPALTV